MGRKTLAAFAFGLFLVMLALGTGCADDGPGDDGVPNHLRVTLSRYFTARVVAATIVVGNAAGDSIIAVRTLTADGTADFGDVHTGRVTLTVHRVTQFPESFSTQIISYRAVPVRFWTFNGGVKPDQDTLGQLTVTASFPRTSDGVLSLGFPGYDWRFVNVQDTTQCVYLGSVSTLDQGSMTLLASMEHSSNRLFGWVIGEPFYPGGENFYSVNLTECLNHQTVTTSREVEDLSIEALRGPDSDPYLLGSYRVSDDAAQFTVDVPDFPAHRYLVYGMNFGSQGSLQKYFSSSSTTDEVPALLNIPEGDIAGSYNGLAKRFEFIAHNGPVDYLWAEWSGQSITWSVYCDPATTVIGMPAIPDSVYNSTVQPLYAFGIGAVDYNTAEGFEEYAVLETESAAYWPLPYTSHYACATSGYSNVAANRDNPPDPALRKLKQFRQSR